MVATATVRRRALSDQQLEQFHRDGFLVVRQLFSAEQIAEIRETFMELAKNGPVEGLSETHKITDPADPLARYPRMMHPHRHSDKPCGPVAMKYMLHPKIGAVVTDLFAEEPISAQSMFYFKPPGARGQDLHQDNFYLRVKPGTCMAAWVAVDDADRENGGMVAVPGSHRMDVQCPKESNREIFFTGDRVDPPAGMTEQPLDLKAGDVLFFNGSVIHGSYPNKSADRFRRAFICHYAPASCQEISRFYRDLYTFDGQPVLKDNATGGGPCGNAHEAPKRPH